MKTYHPPMIIILWTCPKCGAQNTDDYAETIFPTCENVTTHADRVLDSLMWEDILSADEISQANQKLIALEIEDKHQ